MRKKENHFMSQSQGDIEPNWALADGKAGSLQPWAAHVPPSAQVKMRPGKLS